jgi:O-succinylbenzoic acid--CoA ligase
VERVLTGHLGVREAFVLGLDHDQEQHIHAAVALAPPTRVEDVLAYCRAGRLAPYEVPHHFHVLAQLPRNGMGKVDYRKVVAAIRRCGPPAGGEQQ